MKKLSVCLLTTFIFGVLVTSPYAFGEGETKGADAKTPASDKTTIQDARVAAEGGYDAEAGEVKTMLTEIDSQASAISPSEAQIPRAAIKKALGHVSYYSMYHGTCTETQSTAGTICRERTSPQLQDTLNSINTVASMITGVAVKDSCSTFAKIAKLGQMGLTAYTAACSAARAACEASCSTVKSNLDSLIASKIETFSTCVAQGIGPDLIVAQGKCATYTTNVNALIAKISPILKADVNKEDIKSVAMKNVACTYDYANMLVSAGAGIASMIAGMQSGQNCDEASNGTGEAAPVASADLKAKCEKPENAQLPECLCVANPRLPGCANALQKAGESSSSNFSALSSPNAGSTDKSGAGGPDLSGGSDRGLASDPNNKSADSAGGVGAPTGGGGAGLGGGGGGFGSGGAAGSGAADKKGLSANILGGAGGGGSGGGSWGSGGSSSDNAKLRPYLPGGDKDPNKMAGQQNWTKEVTGQGGKSNWEKVRDRYRDNNSSLLNN